MTETDCQSRRRHGQHSRRRRSSRAAPARERCGSRRAIRETVLHLLNAGLFADFTFVTRDGTVPASRTLLYVGSVPLGRLVGTSEHAVRDVKWLPAIAVKTVLSVIYCGGVADNLLDEWKVLCRDGVCTDEIVLTNAYFGWAGILGNLGRFIPDFSAVAEGTSRSVPSHETQNALTEMKRNELILRVCYVSDRLDRNTKDYLDSELGKVGMKNGSDGPESTVKKLFALRPDLSSRMGETKADWLIEALQKIFTHRRDLPFPDLRDADELEVSMIDPDFQTGGWITKSSRLGIRNLPRHPPRLPSPNTPEMDSFWDIDFPGQRYLGQSKDRPVTVADAVDSPERAEMTYPTAQRNKAYQIK